MYVKNTNKSKKLSSSLEKQLENVAKVTTD